MASSLNSTTDEQKPLHTKPKMMLPIQRVLMCPHTRIHRHKTDAGIFPTGPLEIHKYFAKPFIIQSLLNTGPYMGNKFVWY